MTFALVSETDDEVDYINPESVHGYFIRKTGADCHHIRLMLPYGQIILANPENETNGWPTREMAQAYVEDWFVSVMEGIQTREEANSTHFVYRDPKPGDIFHILDNYWEIIGRSPGVDFPVIEMKVLLDENNEFEGRPYPGAKKLRRSADWFTEDNAEFVGTRKEVKQTIKNLQHMWPTVKPFIESALGEESSSLTVIHYALPEDNKVRCCDITYPLPTDHTWSDNINNITCGEFTWTGRTVHLVDKYEPGNMKTLCCGKTQTEIEAKDMLTQDATKTTCPKEKVPSKPCGSTSGHAPHFWQSDDDAPVKSCTGLTFASSYPVDSSGDEAP